MASEDGLAALPEGWVTQVSRSSGDVYYVNTLTNESTYTRPTLPASEWTGDEPGQHDDFEAHWDESSGGGGGDSETADEHLPEGWTTQISSQDGAVYYVRALVCAFSLSVRRAAADTAAIVAAALRCSAPTTHSQTACR
jgi:hypothetical protein